MAAPQSWDCPICLRHVPAKVGECYCGYKRSDPTPEHRAGGGAAGVAVAAVALFAVGGGAAWWLSLPAPEAPRSVATTTLPAARISAHGPYEVPPSTTLPAAWKALAIEATPTPAAAPQLAPSPSPSASPTPDDSIDAKRAKGASDFEAALGALGSRVGEFRDRLKRYNDQCTRENVQVVGCEPARAELQDLAHQIASDVEAADEAARRSWVDPGLRRSLREKSGLDENGVRDLVKAAADAAHH